VSESTVFESTAGESSVDDEATSVISQDELAAYFARLAQEEVQAETQEDGQEEDQ
jgi:isopentenyl phosphate kinase